ncbi:4-alpha-glucanotransferase [Actinobacillus pleuropneumoniae]|nr:4-alpha-glucanotransferase [Actinobacillus pleuropneumoniae]
MQKINKKITAYEAMLTKQKRKITMKSLHPYLNPYFFDEYGRRVMPAKRSVTKLQNA